MRLLVRSALASVMLSSVASCVPEESPESSPAEEEVGTVKEDSVANFYSVLRCTKANPFDYLGYGCFCGAGNSGPNHDPVDATDTCCKAHDECYDTGIPNCNCMELGLIGPPQYTFTCTDGVPTCDPGQGACAAACCACDVKISTCFRDVRPSYQNCFQHWDWKKCGEGVQGCCTDADCGPDVQCIPDVCVDGNCVSGVDFATDGLAAACAIDTETVTALPELRQDLAN